MIVAIIVTYNRKALLQECISALQKQSCQVFDIPVVDNASSDDTGELLSTFAADGTILYFNTGENTGGTEGFNYSLRKTYEIGYEYFWLMDDDAIPTETALEELLKAKEVLNNQFGFLCSYAIWTDGTACQMNVSGWIAEWEGFS